MVVYDANCSHGVLKKSFGLVIEIYTGGGIIEVSSFKIVVVLNP